MTSQTATTYVPNRKIMAAGAVGIPTAVILAWALAQFGISMPPEVSAALGSLISTLIGYLRPE